MIEPLNRCIATFERRGLPVYASRDWHPTDHCSFRLQGGRWPPHCIAGLHGAEPPAELRLPPRTHLVPKGMLPDEDASSAFYATGLGVELREGGCRRVFIGGLATDHCVQATALDALEDGFEAIVLEDAIRALDVHQGDGQRALEELVTRGVHFTTTTSLRDK